MESIKDFFLSEDVKITVKSSSGEEINIDKKSSGSGVQHGLTPGLPIGAPPEPVGGLTEPALVDPGVGSPDPFGEGVQRLAAMVGVRLTEAADDEGPEIDIGDLDPDNADGEGMEDEEGWKKDRAQDKRDSAARSASKPAGYDGRWYTGDEVAGIMPNRDGKGISGEWSWDDLQGERPEIAADFEETGVDPNSGDFMGDDGRVMFRPNDTDQNVWRYLGGDQGWIEIGPEEWEEMGSVASDQDGRASEIDAMPTKFDTSFLDQGSDDEGSSSGSDEDPGFGSLPSTLGNAAPIDDPTSSRAKEEPKKSSGPVRAPEPGSPEWDEFLKNL